MGNVLNCKIYLAATNRNDTSYAAGCYAEQEGKCEYLVEDLA